MTKKPSTHKEIMILDHEEVPGYRRIFYIAISVGVLYLAFILCSTL